MLLFTQLIRQDYKDICRLGKYSRWANKLTYDEFLLLAEIIGELGDVFLPYIKCNKNFIYDIFEGLALDKRGVSGLYILMDIRINGQLLLDTDWAWGRENDFSGEGETFVDEFISVLSDNSDKTKWVVGMASRDFMQILWMVGEFCGRIGRELRRRLSFKGLSLPDDFDIVEKEHVYILLVKFYDLFDEVFCGESNLIGGDGVNNSV